MTEVTAARKSWGWWSRRLLLVVAAAFGAAVITGREIRAQATTLTSTALTDALWLIRGDPGGNILVSTGDDGLLLVDAQSAAVADSLQRALRPFGNRAARLVVNTHYHEDHIGGNGALRALGAVTVAHHRVRLRATVDTTIDELAWHREAAPADQLPMIELGQDLHLRFNRDSIRLITFGSAHTDGDVAVYFGEANVLHVGDIVEVDAYPFVDWWGGGSLAGMIAAVDTFIALVDADTRVVPGHGPVVDRVYLERYRDMLRTTRERVLAAIRRGDDVDQVMGAGLSAEWDEERGGERAGRRFVGILFLGLSQSDGVDR